MMAVDNFCCIQIKLASITIKASFIIKKQRPFGRCFFLLCEKLFQSVDFSLNAGFVDNLNLCAVQNECRNTADLKFVS